VVPVLIGPAAAVREKAKTIGVGLEGVELRDPASDPRRAAFEAEYVQLRQHKGVTPEIARERVALPHYFAALAVRAGEATGFVSGLNSETKPFLPAFEIIKMRQGMKRASSVFVMAWPDRVCFYADCSMNIAPDAETLAEIARASAQSARAFGHEPRVAFLSFSRPRATRP
jgi:phosphate acetyltransferase